MSNFENMVPWILYWEESIVQRQHESNMELYTRAAKTGAKKDGADLGGWTLCGVTLDTYRGYKKNSKLGKNDLDKMTYTEWLGILKSLFWDRVKGDQIKNQSIANLICDWVWASGKYGLTETQKVLGVKADGVFGPKTIDAINSQDPSVLFRKLKAQRINYVDRICKARPANMKFRKGWLRRIEALKFKE